MGQYQAWENEYRSSQLITKNPEPQKDVLRFFKYLKKEEKKELSGLNILDLGCGTGRNSNYLAGLGNKVVGVDISKTAIDIAKNRAGEMQVSDNVSYVVGDIGASYPFGDNYFDLILDITSSNSLNEKERDIYIKEVYRALKDGGYFFVRALCKDGDKNAKNLLKFSPGKENDTYIIKELNLVERVFSEKDFKELYGKYFKIKKLFKKSGYAKFQNQSYKRNYWLAYMQKSSA
ncbi:MAG: class I SAM-dependent methyltransferase [Candidatus Pacebacteria bacterium]|nr:class I SAM-dependent methyltransferase [Candidatus Paceibacterota bacterium]